MLAEAAWTVARSPGTDLHAQYHRIARRRGKDTATMAATHRLPVLAYCLLRDQQPYRDLGPTSLDERDAARTGGYHVRRLEQLGYSVALSPAAGRCPLHRDLRGMPAHAPTGDSVLRRQPPVSGLVVPCHPTAIHARHA
jgi:hypothetical protein